VLTAANPNLGEQQSRGMTMTAIVRAQAASAKRRATKVVATGLGMLLLSQGCHAPAARKLAAPPRLDERSAASLGTVGVYSVGPTPAAVVDGPVGTGEEALKGAASVGGIGMGAGAGGGALTGAGIGLACGPWVAVCVPAFALMGATIGGVAGLVVGGTVGGVQSGTNAIPTDVAENATAAVTAALSSRDLHADLRSRTIALDQGTAHRIDLGGDSTRPPSTREYARFAPSGVDTVLEIKVARVALIGEGNDPDLALAIDAQARLIRLPEGEVLWENQEMMFASAPAKLSAGTADDSRLLKSEVDRGLETLAKRLGEVVA
jgi:hypothetical protein